MVATIFGGLAATESRTDRKLTARRVFAVNTEDAIANPSYRPWSEVPITFNRGDLWVDIPYIGRFPLILNATIKKVLFRKVLVDGGSALNLLFAGALKELGLRIGDLTHSNSSFWVWYLAGLPSHLGRSRSQYSSTRPATTASNISTSTSPTSTPPTTPYLVGQL